MRNKILKVFFKAVSRVFIASGMLAGTPVAAMGDDFSAAYQDLAEQGDASAEQWFELAMQARAGDDLFVDFELCGGHGFRRGKADAAAVRGALAVLAHACASLRAATRRLINVARAMPRPKRPRPMAQGAMESGAQS